MTRYSALTEDLVRSGLVSPSSYRIRYLVSIRSERREKLFGYAVYLLGPIFEDASRRTREKLLPCLDVLYENRAYTDPVLSPGFTELMSYGADIYEAMDYTEEALNFHVAAQRY